MGSLILTCLLLLATRISFAHGAAAEECVPAACELPHCRCASTDIPGGLLANNTPQMITFGFIGNVRKVDYDKYLSPVLAGRTNPDGCSIPATFFVSNNYTSYALVESLAAQGHEIADYSVTARPPRAWWAAASLENLTQEIVDMKDIIKYWSNVPKSNIKGYRSPHLGSSENAIRVLHGNDNGFQYDASMETSSMYWPFTLDYKSPICTSPAVCPNNSYPGLWVVPNIVHEQNGTIFTCGELDICLHTTTRAQWFQFFKNNFHRHYDGNRAPFSLYTSVSWFSKPDRVAALQDFLDYVSNITDTYFVTHAQLLDWVRNPTPLSEIGSFESWKCPSLPPARCDYQSNKTLCSYATNTGTEYLNLCDDCPISRPGLGNPLGEDPPLSPPSMSATDAPSSSEIVPSSSSEIVPTSSSENVPPSSSENVPPSSSENVPPSSSEIVPSSSSEIVPFSSSENVPSSSSENVPSSSSENVPSSSSEIVPSSSSENVPSSSSEIIPSSSSANVPPSSSEIVPFSSSENVPSSSSEIVPSSSSEIAPSSSSANVPPSSSEIVPFSSSENVPSSSSEIAPSSSSASVVPTSTEDTHTSEASSSIPAAASSHHIAHTTSVHLSPSPSTTVTASSSATVPPSRSALDAESSSAGLGTDAAVGLALGLGMGAVTAAAVGIAASALVAYVIFKKKAAYNAIKGVNSVSMELLSNPSTGPVLA